MKIIMGLGNPGKEYQQNRHNLGFRCIDLLAKQHSLTIKKQLCQSSTGEGSIDGCNVILVKPKTYVNLSGNTASCLLQKLKLKPQDLIVIHDDLDLPTGRLRIRMGGKSGGHRGIRSIINSLGTEEFTRIKIGISRPFRGPGTSYDDAIVDYVLGDLSDQEEEEVAAGLHLACEAINCLLTEGLESVMNKYNKKT